jgi:type IV secretion system protein VirB1
MGYTAATLLSLASQCAPNVAPQTVVALVHTESRGRPLALNVNGAKQPRAPTSEADAIATAQLYVNAGYSVDLGLGQINSRNMRSLGLTWATVFDPCTNIAALGQILSQNYRAVIAGRDPQTALRLAFSLYNTGNTSRGFRNGYVAKVVGNAGVAAGTTAAATADVLSAMSSRDTLRDRLVAENALRQTRALPNRPPPPPAWNLFERAAYDRQTQILAENERASL